MYSNDPRDPHNHNDLSTRQGCLDTGRQLGDLSRPPEWRHGMSWNQYQWIDEGYRNR